MVTGCHGNRVSWQWMPWQRTVPESGSSFSSALSLSRSMWEVSPSLTMATMAAFSLHQIDQYGRQRFTTNGESFRLSVSLFAGLSACLSCLSVSLCLSESLSLSLSLSLPPSLSLSLSLPLFLSFLFLLSRPLTS